MIQPTLTDLDDLILPTCLVCGRIGEHRDEIIHKRTCVLARPPADPAQRGSELLTAADAMAEAVLDVAYSVLQGPIGGLSEWRYLTRDAAAIARARVDIYRALRGGQAPEDRPA